MTSFLKGRRLWRYAKGDITVPVKETGESDTKFAERLEEWDSQNHKILTWIRNCSIPSIRLQFGRFDSAKEVWDLLSKRYSTVHIANQYQLHESLRTMKQVSQQSVNDFLSNMQAIWDQLALSEPKWECTKDAEKFLIYRDNFRVMQFPMALHADYEPVRASLLHRETFPRLENVVAELLSEETRLGILNKCSLDSVGQQAVLASPSTNMTSEKTCKYCHRPGHVISECRKLKRKKEQQGQQSRFFPNNSVVAIDTKEGAQASISLSDLQAILNQMGSQSTSASVLSAIPGPAKWQNSGNRS